MALKISGLLSRASLILVCGLVGSTGCMHREPAPAAENERASEQALEHRVALPGETLAVIAKHYTGKAANWKAIADYNRGLKPERLRLGQTILIPRELVSNERPLTKEEVKLWSPPKPVDSARQAGAQIGTGQVTDQTSTGQVEQPATDGTVQTTETSRPIVPSDAVQNLGGAAQVKSVSLGNSEPAAPSPPSDAEREKLLDELLKQ